MQATTHLTERQWQVAGAIASTLVLEEVDVNELKKIISYFRAYANSDQAGKRFFTYLKTLVRNGDRIGHSQRTLGYYRSIEKTCSQYLESYQEDAFTMLQILGWAARLMQYYKEVPIGEISEPTIQSEREAEIQAIKDAHDFKIGQILEATIPVIKGNKVTYEVLGTIRLTQKEPKQAAILAEGQNIKVEITELKDDGSIKKLKVID
ncbi:MAG: hypothetical protein LRZ84_13745 [Desertifilum sp.]|nr:hypothetical protein [Desertifilum sp.]